MGKAQEAHHSREGDSVSPPPAETHRGLELLREVPSTTPPADGAQPRDTGPLRLSASPPDFNPQEQLKLLHFPAEPAFTRLRSHTGAAPAHTALFPRMWGKLCKTHEPRKHLALWQMA